MRTASATLPDALEVAARTGAGVTFHLRSGTERLSYAELSARASVGAAQLTSLGVRPGDMVGILGPNHPQWAVAAFATWIAGAVVVPLQYSLLAGTATTRELLTPLLASVGCRRVLGPPGSLAAVPAGVGQSWEGLGSSAPSSGAARSATGTSRVPLRPDDVAAIQFTSGSTAAPKGVVLEHAAVVVAVTLSGSQMELAAGGAVASWLPFFHDYGLWGFLVRPLVFGVESHVLPTEEFARDPRGWFRLLERTRAPHTEGPPSGWGAALRATLRAGDWPDLGGLRTGVVAAEMIDPELVDAFREHGPALGLREHTLSGAYGLAEMTLGVTSLRPGEPWQVDRVDPQQLSTEHRAVASAAGKRIVSCGRPWPGLDLRITRGGIVVGQRSVGEIELRGPSAMRGYHDGTPHLTPDGWLRTGDLGYLAEDELFVTGREKDLLIVYGRNIAPEDLEWVAGRVAGVRAGRCVAFARPHGGEGEAVLVVECRDEADPAAVVRAVRGAVGRSLGMSPARVVAVAEGTVPKTTSGKLRRRTLASAYEEGRLEELAAIG